ncbi:hypothetical protein C2E20_6390 isoform B [Micractinium conductrix]|uniref:phytol kinase n=1 Tax=Micractinium conductrix TaxID=554055 RepID=A0A2P6V7T2_9CHLO|nr:hypothetical protein C2E20_6390 isoform B [Micractinium conductrix]|eukprot:PSC70146.1 hypothetical protein C2E20_6390 isoform B [Micractinium conductrix]
MAYIGVRVLKALRALHEHGAAAQLTDEEAGGVLAWPLAGPPCMARLLSGIMAGNYDCQAADFFAVLCSDVAELHTLGGGYEAALRSVQALVAPLLHGLMEAAERLALPAELQSSLPEAEAAGVVAQLRLACGQRLQSRGGMRLRCTRLLHSVRLQHAEGSARILPLSAELRSFWGNRDGGATIAPLAEQSGEEAAASVRTLASARRCGNMRCVEVAGASDASLPLRMCSVCRVPRYCSEQCQHADWRAGHRRLCRQLAAERAAGAGAAAAEAEGSSGGG